MADGRPPTGPGGHLLLPRGSRPLSSAPWPPPSRSPWAHTPLPSLALSPEPTKTQAWAAARLSHQMQERGAGALPGAGLGASSTSGIDYQQWLCSGLLSLPLTYLPG